MDDASGPTRRRRARRQTAVVAAVALAAATLTLSGCLASDGRTTVDDCTSRYDDVASAPTRRVLDEKLVTQVDPAVDHLRHQGVTEASGDEHQHADVVDLVTARGRRVMQVEVYRLADGSWFAGRWAQCID